MILAREAARGVEVLVLTRGSSSRFLPGYVVFPGGTIEPSDPDLAATLFGDPSQAPRACALRELYEEAGIRLPTLTRQEMPEIARWVAPEFLETRFDARFFAAAAPSGIDPVPDGSEVVEARWASPGELVEGAAAGEVDLMWPTLVTMKALAGCGGVDDVLGLRVEQIPSPEAAR